MSMSPNMDGALMERERMSVRLNLRWIRVVAVLVDLAEQLIVEIAGYRRVVPAPALWVQDHKGARLPSSPGS